MLLHVRDNNCVVFMLRNESILNLKKECKEIFYTPFLKKKNRRLDILSFLFIYFFTQEIIPEFLLYSKDCASC